MTTCKYCQTEITWKKEGEKSVPYNIDNTPHRCKKAAAPTTNTLIGRITEYEGSNVHLGSKIFFLTPEDRKVAQESFPVGTVVRFTYDKGTCKGMQKATGTDLEKFLKEEGEQRAPPSQAKPPAVATPAQPQATASAIKKDEWTEERDEFKALLSSVNRDGIAEMLAYLENETDFFIAPSSTKYHDARDGGLLHHSLKVYHNLVEISRLFEGEYPEDVLKIIGLLHDVCKANFYRTSFRNVKHENCTIPDCQCRFNNGWNKEPFIDIDDQLPLGHGEKSVILVQQFIKLTNVEIMGIRWHMMAYDDLHNSYAGNIAITNASSKYQIIVLMHIADLSASFLEMKVPEVGGA